MAVGEWECRGWGGGLGGGGFIRPTLLPTACDRIGELG